MTHEAKQVERRIHSRYLLGDPRLARIILPGEQTLTINDLSYSGFSTALNSKVPTTIATQLRFCLLDQEVSAQAKVVHRTETKLGFMFEHTDPRTLLFLRKPLEQMRLGHSLEILDPEHLKEKYQTDHWIVLRGDGPTDVSLNLDATKQLQSLLLTSRSSGLYYELRYGKETGLQTAETSEISATGQKGLAAKMTPSPSPNTEILRSAVFILASIADHEIRDTCADVFDQCFRALGL